MNILAQDSALSDQVQLEEDLTFDGEFDGKIDLPPNQAKWHNLSYRNGYLVGQGYFYDKKFNIDHSDSMPF